MEYDVRISLISNNYIYVTIQKVFNNYTNLLDSRGGGKQRAYYIRHIINTRFVLTELVIDLGQCGSCRVQTALEVEYLVQEDPQFLIFQQVS